MDNPLVSVIIPTYNYARFICEAIDSIFNSDFPQDEIEIIVIDDGSTDNTYEKVMTYGERVNYLIQENSGKAWATQVGINYARGKYLFNLDADDLFLPTKIQEVVRVFETDPNIVHVAHPALCWHIDKEAKTQEVIPPILVENKIFGRELLSYFYERRIFFGGGSTFAARADAIKTFSIPKEVDMYIDEYLVLFTAQQGYSFLIDKPLSVWRIHEKNYSGNNLDINTLKIKARRDIQSMEAVLSEILKNNFSEDIKKIYSLKVKLHEISMKEQFTRKSLLDVMNLWVFFFKNFSLGKHNLVRLTKVYNLLNRSLPTFIIKFMRSAKKKLPFI